MEIGIAFFAFACGFFVSFRRNMKKWKKSFSLNKDFWNIHTRIHESLTELRVKVDCARTQLVQFHNGGEFLDGISMKKMTLTHESLEGGISSEMKTKKDILLSGCINGMNLLLENDPKIHITQLMEDSWCKQFLESNNVVSFSFLPIKTKSQITGYIMCQWCSWSKADLIDEELIKEPILSARNIIEVELSYGKNHKP